jgi:hypothetical protein
MKQSNLLWANAFLLMMCTTKEKVPITSTSHTTSVDTVQPEVVWTADSINGLTPEADSLLRLAYNGKLPKIYNWMPEYRFQQIPLSVISLDGPCHPGIVMFIITDEPQMVWLTRDSINNFNWDGSYAFTFERTDGNSSLTDFEVLDEYVFSDSCNVLAIQETIQGDKYVGDVSTVHLYIASSVYGFLDEILTVEINRALYENIYTPETVEEEADSIYEGYSSEEQVTPRYTVERRKIEILDRTNDGLPDLKITYTKSVDYEEIATSSSIWRFSKKDMMYNEL